MEALADALGRLLSDEPLAAGLRLRGLERAAAHTWERCAEATLGAYREALARTSS